MILKYGVTLQLFNTTIIHSFHVKNELMFLLRNKSYNKSWHLPYYKDTIGMKNINGIKQLESTRILM